MECETYSQPAAYSYKCYVKKSAIKSVHFYGKSEVKGMMQVKW